MARKAFSQVGLRKASHSAIRVLTRDGMVRLREEQQPEGSRQTKTMRQPCTSCRITKGGSPTALPRRQNTRAPYTSSTRKCHVRPPWQGSNGPPPTVAPAAEEPAAVASADPPVKAVAADTVPAKPAGNGKLEPLEPHLESMSKLPPISEGAKSPARPILGSRKVSLIVADTPEPPPRLDTTNKPADASTPTATAPATDTRVSSAPSSVALSNSRRSSELSYVGRRSMRLSKDLVSASSKNLTDLDVEILQWRRIFEQSHPLTIATLKKIVSKEQRRTKSFVNNTVDEEDADLVVEMKTDLRGGVRLAGPSCRSAPQRRAHLHASREHARGCAQKLTAAAAVAAELHRNPLQSLMAKQLTGRTQAAKAQLEGPDNKVITLPRGGTYVRTTSTPVQVGMPPETIKDCMHLKLDLPTYYVIPAERFNRRVGLSVAEFEFPAYFNFFVKRGRLTLICTVEDEKVVRRIFQETLFGPTEPNALLEDEAHDHTPDLQKELDFFRMNPFKPTERMEIETLIDFIHFDEKHEARFVPKDAAMEVIVRWGDQHYHILERDLATDTVTPVASLDDYVELPDSVFNIRRREARDWGLVAAISNLGISLSHDFQVPLFGCTFLGTSHGFDPAGSTTGFVLWMNGRGVMVDPPPFCSDMLMAEGIPPKIIDAIIVTHCHADHDGGTFQKLLEEQRVTVLTTPTIMGSFLRKYSAVVGLEEESLRRLFTFMPVTFDAPLKVHGGTIRFFYALHAIPCMGFEASFGGKSIIYSGDTLYLPDRIEEMHQKGVLSDERRDQLLNFNFGADLILHEAGVPPLHTPVSELAKLAPDVKERMYLVHVSASSAVFDEGLQVASCGVVNTLRVEVDEKYYQPTVELMDIISSLDLFRPLPLSKSREILQCVERVHYKRGDTVYHEGDVGSSFYIVERGAVCVSSDRLELDQLLTIGCYIGEASVLSHKPRWASVTCLSDVCMLKFDRGDFQRMIMDTDLQSRMEHTADMRLEPTWEILAKNRHLSHLTECQKCELLGIMKKRTIPANNMVWSRGTEASCALLIKTGSMKFLGQTVAPFTSGTLVGEIDCLLGPQFFPATSKADFMLDTTLVSLEECEVYELDKEGFSQFLLHNPGVLLKALNTSFLE